MLGKAAEVISAYQGESHQAERVEGEQGSRWGSGEAQIVHVELHDADGKPTAVLTTHEPATIHVELTAHTPLQDTVVGVRIDSLAGGPVWETSTRRSGRTIGLIDGPASGRRRDRQPPAARRRLRPDRGAHRPHRGASVRPLGATRPVRGPAVQVVRHRPREHPGRVDDHRRTRRGPDRPVTTATSRASRAAIAARFDRRGEPRNRARVARDARRDRRLDAVAVRDHPGRQPPAGRPGRRRVRCSTGGAVRSRLLTPEREPRVRGRERAGRRTCLGGSDLFPQSRPRRSRRMARATAWRRSTTQGGDRCAGAARSRRLVAGGRPDPVRQRVDGRDRRAPTC